jgi:hypothetical protein
VWIDYDITLSTPTTTFSGMKISGAPNPGYQVYEQNPKLVRTRVTLACGQDNSSAFVGTATTYGIYIGNLTLTSSNQASQFYHHPLSAGTSFATTIENMEFFGLKYGIGNPTNRYAATLNKFIGAWQIQVPYAEQICMGGSDNDFWVEGSCNIGDSSSVAGAGKYLIILNGMDKTTVGPIYVTAKGAGELCSCRARRPPPRT